MKVYNSCLLIYIAHLFPEDFSPYNAFEKVSMYPSNPQIQVLLQYTVFPLLALQDKHYQYLLPITQDC